jgi:cellulose synthase operon protein C
MCLAPALFLGAPLARAAPADDQFAVAAGHYKQQRWKLAAEEFSAFLTKYADHKQATRARFYLAESLVQLRQYQPAAQQFHEFLTAAPADKLARKALFRAGESSYLASQWEPAEQDLKAFLAAHADDPLNAYVLPYLGDIAAKKRDYATAQHYFAQGLRQFPQGAMQDDCRFGLARALDERGDRDQARRLYLALSAKPSSGWADEAQYRLGVSYYTSGDYAQALDCFRKFDQAFAKSRLRFRAALAAGQSLYQLRRVDEAQPILEGLAEHAEVGLEARYWLGLTLEARRDWPAASEMLSAVAEAAAPTDRVAPAARFHAGEALLRGGKPDDAERQFQLVLDRWPQSEFAERALVGSMQVALARGQHPRVDELVGQFHQRHPGSKLAAAADRALGRSLLDRKQWQPAIAIFERLVAAPEAKSSQAAADRYLLATGYLGVERFADALALLTPAAGQPANDVPATEDERQLRLDIWQARAMALMGLERFADAQRALEALLAAKPTEKAAAWAQAELAVALARQGRIDQAKSFFGQVTASHPDIDVLPAARLALAEAALAHQDYAWSNELFTELASGSSAYATRGLSGLAWSQYKAGQLAEASASFERLLTEHADDPLAAEAALARGQILERLKQDDVALAMYQRVIGLDRPCAQLPQAMLLAARLYERQGQPKEAVALYERLDRRLTSGDFKPEGNAAGGPAPLDRDELVYRWAWASRDLGEQEKADELFERLRQAQPRSRFWAEAVYRLADRAFQTGQLQRAEQLVGELTAAESDRQVTPHALMLAGKIAAARDDWKQVVPPLARLVEQFPDSAPVALAEYFIAEAAYRQADYDKAFEQLRELAENTVGRDEKWRPMIPLRQAQILARKEQWRDALEIASQIATDYPDFEQQYEADYVIGRCQASLGDFDEARAAYRRAVESTTGEKTETAAMAQWMIGESYMHQKNYEAALREYLRVEILYDYPTWQAAALLQAGKCHEALGEWSQAGELYTRLIKNYPQTEFAKDAGERLKSAQSSAQAKN